MKAFAHENSIVAGKIICLREGRKLCRERRKYRLSAFSPFSTMYSKGFFLKVVKKLGWFGKEFNNLKVKNI